MHMRAGLLSAWAPSHLDAHLTVCVGLQRTAQVPC